MPAHPTLTTVPTDIQHLLLSILPDFDDLGAMVLTHRAFHEIYKARQNSLLHDVARNLLGCLFDEALLLARQQDAKFPALGGGEAVDESLSTNIIGWIMNNDYVVAALERVMFGLLKVDGKKFDVYDAESLGRFADDPFTVEASPTESIRFKGAAYRFWRFCLKPDEERVSFLEALAVDELLELENFVGGISNLIYAMRRQPQESDHDFGAGDFIASVQGTGPDRILDFWIALQNDDPEFEENLDGAGSAGEEGFFDYPLAEVKESKQIDGLQGLRSLSPILDGDNEKMKEILAQVVKLKGSTQGVV
ncbi:hypothetical protein B0H16DRAFT_1692821 [Mycena metata]|uniref:Uncharacterized protein n=1 Tax=Mycena metata TaxID=1033252 RepID=A0AAD7ILN0_9AGAR|nr:hypothetical protein B0H16DRAFT_1692821 [Mycena metata]